MGKLDGSVGDGLDKGDDQGSDRLLIILESLTS